MTYLRKFSSLCAALTVFAIATPVNAEPHLNCAAYASAAVAQYEHAKALGCGFGGGRWSANYNGHFNWCKQAGVTISMVSTEDHLRKQGLQQCGSKTAQCNTYAKNAVATQATNIAKQCGKTGGRWSANFNGHKNWCMGASDSAIKHEENQRVLAILSCK